MPISIQARWAARRFFIRSGKTRRFTLYSTLSLISMRKHIKKISVSLILPCLFLVILHAIAWAAEKPTLEDIEFNTPSSNEERITFKLNGTYIPKIFAIKGKKPRVVFDFPDTQTARTLNNIIKTNGKFIKQIRIGIHKGKNPKTRVVLDLIPDKDINFNQNFDQKKNALTVSVYYAGTEPSKPEKPATKPKVKAEPKKSAVGVPVPPPVKVEQPAQASVPAPPQPQEQPVPPPKVVEKTTPPARQAAVQKKPVSPPPVARKPSAPVRQPEIQHNKPVERPQPKGNEPPTLRSVKFDNSSNRGEMIQFKLNDFYPPIVFGIEEGLPRVVCDFKDTRADASLKETIKTNGRYVKAIRIGRHKNPSKIRVVIDLEPNNNYDLQQVFFKEDNLFVIIVNIMHNTPPVTELEKPLKP